MANLLVQSKDPIVGFKPSVLVDGSAIVSWTDDERVGHEATITLSLEQLDAGARAIVETRYNWRDNLPRELIDMMSSSSDQAVDLPPHEADIDLGTRNLIREYASHASIEGFLKSVYRTLELPGSQPLVTRPESYKQRDLEVRKAVLTLTIRHLLVTEVQRIRSAAAN